MKGTKRYFLLVFLMSVFCFAGKAMATGITLEDLRDNYATYSDENSDILSILNLEENEELFLSLEDDNSVIIGVDVVGQLMGWGFRLNYDEDSDTLFLEFDDDYLQDVSDTATEDALIQHLLYTKLRLEGYTKEEAEDYIEGLDDLIVEEDDIMTIENNIITMTREKQPTGGYFLRSFSMKVSALSREVTNEEETEESEEDSTQVKEENVTSKETNISDKKETKKVEEKNPQTSDYLIIDAVMLVLSTLSVGIITKKISLDNI